MIRLFALGGISLQRDDDEGRPVALAHTKRHAVLAYLAIEPTNGAHARDTLLALFWPESDERHARDALKQILRSLRRDLGDGAFESSGSNGVALSESIVWCDATELRRAAERGEHAATLDLYRGELLPAMHLPGAPEFESWAARRGAELRRLASTAGRRLATEREEQGDLESAIRTVQRVLVLEPYDEASVRTLMRLHMAAGNNAGAVVAYEAYARRVEEELDVGPTEETVALLQTARDRHPAAPNVEELASAPPLDTHLAAGPPPQVPPSQRRPSSAKIRPARPPRWVAAGLAVMFAAAITALQATRAPDGEEVSVRIVAFPFESVGPPDRAYFAAGLTDELRARLASVPGLAVVSAADRGSGLPPVAPDSLGRALDAAYVFLGSVRWLQDEGAPARVRVVPRLIRTEDRTEIWTDTYEAYLEDIFDVQSRIARALASQLGATLVGYGEVPEPPTSDLEAYAFLLRGRDFLRREWVGRNLLNAESMFEQAVEKDPRMAEGWAGLSLARSELWMGGWENTPSMAIAATEAAERASTLDPESPEAHFATAMVHYRLHLRYEPALRHLEIVERARPGDPDVLLARAYLERRRGEWETALSYHRRALEVEPRVARGRGGLVWTLIPLRRFREAEAAIEEALELFPDMRGFHGTAAYVHMYQGDVARARGILEAAERGVAYRRSGPTWFTLELLSRRYDAALDMLGNPRGAGYADRALIHGLMGDSAQARMLYDSARVALERGVENRPDDAALRSLLGIAYAGSGRLDDGLREAERAIELLPLSRDAIEGATMLERMARVRILRGEQDEAVSLLEYLLSIPSEVSVSRLRIDPRYDALRSHPAFERLLADADAQRAPG